MILGVFSGWTVGMIKSKIVAVEKQHQRLVQVRKGIDQSIEKALADRETAIAEIRGEILTLASLKS